MDPPPSRAILEQSCALNPSKAAGVQVNSWLFDGTQMLQVRNR